MSIDVRFQWRGEDLQNLVYAAVVRAQEENAMDLAAKAKALAPIESGDLRASIDGTLTEATLTRPEDGGTTWYVGSNLPYALRQHEDLSLRHSGPEHGETDGGQAKYLEQPLNESREQYLQNIRDGIAEVLR